MFVFAIVRYSSGNSNKEMLFHCKHLQFLLMGIGWVGIQKTAKKRLPVRILFNRYRRLAARSLIWSKEDSSVYGLQPEARLTSLPTFQWILGLLY